MSGAAQPTLPMICTRESCTFRHTQTKLHWRLNRWQALCVAALLSCQYGRAAETGPQMQSPTLHWSWTLLPSLPDEEGYAGSFAGVHNSALIVGGGANFPGLKPWEGGAKKWYDKVFVLTVGESQWREVGRLPRPLAYGASLTTRDGIACLGGSDDERHYSECFLMKYEGGKLAFSPLPSLPHSCANASGAAVGDTLYLAGGTEGPDSQSALRSFWSLDLNRLDEGWKPLESVPGPGRILATMGVQSGAVYLFGGAALQAHSMGPPTRRSLRDAYKYTPGGHWVRIANLPHPVVAAPSPAPSMGPAHLLLLGGDDGSQASLSPLDHRGFSREALAYHTVTDKWSSLGELPFALVTTSAVPWNKYVVVPGGERRPGIRSTEVWAGELQNRRTPFGWANYVALLTYLGGMVGIGWVCAARNKNTDDYFTASGRIPWWAAGISIYATTLSSITFMAVPAKAYATDWTFFWASVPILVLAPFIIRFYLPFFRQVKVASAYEYLERRFHLGVRWYASAAFIVFQIGRQSIVLLLPSMALAAVSDLDISTCVVLMGMLCVAYTVIGGMEAVVWTDVAQTVVLLGAAILSLLLIVLRTDGGIEGFWSIAQSHHKFNMFNFTCDPDIAANSFWVILLGNLFISLVTYTSDQAVVQRYMTTKDESTAGQAIWTNALLAIPSAALFFAIGTALFVYYYQHPEALEPGQPTDAVFPVFIVQHMPAGVAGIVIAGIFAAAQSTVSGSLNSVVTALMTDFYCRWWGTVDDARLLRLARWWTGLIGLFATLVALALAKLNLASMWDAYFNLVGLAGSGLAALFALGIFTRRTTGTGALIGAVISAAVLCYVQRYTHIHFLLYSLIGFGTCFISGWVASCLLPMRPHLLTGLTIFTLEPGTERICTAENK